MSDSTGRTRGDTTAPRAIIHKQILDCAESRPDASLVEIARDVSGATVATVERVLEEYGDPADPDEATDDDPSAAVDGPEATATATATDGGTSSGADSCSSDDSTTTRSATEGESARTLDRSALTEKQRETLRAIYEHPDATQADLAAELGVSSPTINQRVNSIDGFDWSNRHALVESVFEPDDASERRVDDEDVTGDDRDVGADGRRQRDADTRRGSTTDSGEGDADAHREPATDREEGDGDADPTRQQRLLLERIDELTRQVQALEDELAALERQPADRGDDAPVLADPELAHKIVHACVHSDRITEEEELRLLRAITATGAEPTGQ